MPIHFWGSLIYSSFDHYHTYLVPRSVAPFQQCISRTLTPGGYTPYFGVIGDYGWCCVTSLPIHCLFWSRMSQVLVLCTLDWSHEHRPIVSPSWSALPRTENESYTASFSASGFAIAHLPFVTRLGRRYILRTLTHSMYLHTSYPFLLRSLLSLWFV